MIDRPTAIALAACAGLAILAVVVGVTDIVLTLI